MPSKQDLEGADTLTPAADATVPPSLETPPNPQPNPPAVAATQVGDSGRIALGLTFPVDKWDRYELLGELGKGGMGAVYKARDRRLGRIVALKFILGAHPNLVMRFLQEARAQARIDHPNVCHVYEVGEVEGRAYIAMQLIEGEQLNKASASMSLDEKVAVMRDVALAIHEAHKLGIVHRDLKPANILVERGEDGRWFPVVMDFGLAREATVETGLTESGALLGTPAYMSPEQARGDQRTVDRRSDVYSLGATFYELITGQPPFTQPSLALMLEQVMKSDPATPRSLVSTMPIDLETIALKCLAKEPERRYASARALADDLGRYLDGEPILGRRPSLLHRLRLRARRNRALVGVTLSSLALILVVAGFGIRAGIISRRERARASERSQLAEALGRDAKEIEWLLRAAYQLPLHDTTPERSLIKERMQRIAATPHDLGALGDAAIFDALGRGDLALHQWPEAAENLARAAAAGLDTPGLHAARGRALGELYHRALEDARRAGDKTWLAGREKELEQKYLAPALAELDKSRGVGDPGADPALLEALVALYRQDYTRAEERALGVAARKPWLFEARKVAADAAYEAAVDKLDHGSYDEARAGLEHATTLYAQAAEVARSDASVHGAAAEAWLEHAEIDFRQGRSPKEAIDHALTAVDNAIVADPRDAPAYTTKASVLLRWYRTPALRSGDQRLFLERLAKAAARATEIDPHDANAWDALALAHLYRGMLEMRGSDPTPWWNQALDELGRALAIQPNHPWANNDLGVVHRWIGNHIEEEGHDPTREYQAASRSYQRAAEIDPRYVIALGNEVDIDAIIAEYQAQHGRDPTDVVASARSAGERCLAIDGNYYVVLENMAQSEVALSEYLVAADRDPRSALGRAAGYLDRSLKIQPTNTAAHYDRLWAAVLEAGYQLQSNRDPSAAIARGNSAFAESVRLYPDCADCFVAAAKLDLAAADSAAQRHGATGPLLERALTHAKRAAALPGQSSNARVVAAQAYLRLAADRPDDGAAIREGLTMIDAALAANAGDADTHAVRAALLVARARTTSDQALRRRDAAAARDEMARSLAINPLLKREWGGVLREAETILAAK